MDTDEALVILKSGPNGLNKDEISLRKAVYGPNRIKTAHKINPLLIFLKQFKDFLIIILLVATVISLLIGETLDGIVVLGIVILCAFLGFFQEFRSEKTVEALKKMASPTARVIREGRKMMSTIHSQGNNKQLIATKGAPEVIMKRCSHIQQEGEIFEITNQVKERILSVNEAMAKKALRVLALAWREIPNDGERFDSDRIERGLVFCGLVGMIDPPREEVLSSVGPDNGFSINDLS
jgi:magnesium-transporting ATPase (P-type)